MYVSVPIVITTNKAMYVQIIFLEGIVYELRFREATDDSAEIEVLDILFCK